MGVSSEGIRIRVELLEVPLTMQVTQASSSRSTASALWVTAERSGNIGFGEGCPRPYVTGETLQGAFEWCVGIAPRLSDVADLRDLKALTLELDDEIGLNPAAWCALELGVLDLLAHEAECSIEQLLGIDTQQTTFEYTAVVDDSSDAQFELLKDLYSDAGFSDFKLKVNGNPELDAERVGRILAAGAQNVRLDANNYWELDTDRATKSLAAVDGWWAVEEPFVAGAADEMSKLATTLECSVILDESLTTTQDVERFSHLPGSWVANVKVSKSGGMLRSIAIINAAITAGWPVIIGAQVGETSVLTRAGIAAARAAGPHLRAIEGGFGSWLLSEDPVAPIVMWGAGGILDIGNIDLAPRGWGLSKANNE